LRCAHTTNVKNVDFNATALLHSLLFVLLFFFLLLLYHHHLFFG